MQPNDQNPTDLNNDQTPKQNEQTAPLVPGSTNESAAPAVEGSPAQPEVVAPTNQPQAEAQPVAPSTATTGIPAATEQPTQAQQAPAQVTTPDTNPVAAAPAGGLGSGNKGKKKLSVLLIAVIAALVLLAGGAGAYFGVYLPNQPQQIAADALANSVNRDKLKSSGFEGEISFSGENAPSGLSGITFEGSSDSASKAFSTVFSVKTAVTTINLDVRSTDSKTFYAKVSGLDGLDQLLSASAAGSTNPQTAAIAQLAPIIAQVNDVWYSIDESLLSQIPGADVSTATELSPEDAEKLGDIYKNNQFLNIDERLDDQEINGVDSYHVKASIDKEKLKSFMNELKSANIEALALEDEAIDQLNEVDFSKYPFEMWVSKKDRFLTQVSAQLEDNGIEYKIRLALKDINQPVNVEAPADAKSILELTGQLLPLFMGGMGSSATPVTDGAPTSQSLMGL